MAPKKQKIAHNNALSKGRTKTTARGMIPLQTIDRERVEEDISSSSTQRATANAHAPPLYEGENFQMLADMKEQMKKQQTWSDRDR